MTTLQALAAELGAQPHELSAFMGWDSPTTQPAGYDPDDISDDLADEAKEVWGHSASGVYAPPEIRALVSAHQKAVDLKTAQEASAADRDERVREAVAQGHSVQAIADALGVDRQRVYQMARKK